MSMKNSNDTTWDRTSDLPICSYRVPPPPRKCEEWGKLQRVTRTSITSTFFVRSRGKAVGSEKELWRSYVKSPSSIQEGSQIYPSNYQPTKSSWVCFRHAAGDLCRRKSSLALVRGNSFTGANR